MKGELCVINKRLERLLFVVQVSSFCFTVLTFHVFGTDIIMSCFVGNMYQLVQISVFVSVYMYFCRWHMYSTVVLIVVLKVCFSPLQSLHHFYW